MEAIMDYCILKNKTNPWGDYGDILFTGFLNTFTYEKVKVKKTMRGKKINRLAAETARYSGICPRAVCYEWKLLGVDSIPYL
jgi:hypothetical protein